MSLPPGFLDELQSRLSLAQIVGRKVSWDPRKTNPSRGDYWAPCPFHQEKTASFHVDDGKGFFYCFGCHAKGDVIGFVRETENLGFMEAVERLASEAGLELPAQDPAQRAARDRTTRLGEALEAAVAFYRLSLGGARGAAARGYLDRRGVAPDARAAFELGFAPEGRAALAEHLGRKGFSAAELAEAGLVILPERGGAPFDRFRGRLMFPIRDGRGRAIGFGGRALAAGQEPKYLNSPETPLFHKGRTLYNLGPARAAAGKTGRLVVVEGYMDVIALAGAGVGAAVAPLGTAITEDQLALLWRLHPEPVIALDGDAAGLRAAEKLIDRALPLLGPDRALRFALLPAGQDPDDVARAGGAAALDALLDGSRSLLDLVWTREAEAQPLDSPERRAAFDARLRARIARIGDAGLRAHYAAEIRNRRAALFSPRREDGRQRPQAKRPGFGFPKGRGQGRADLRPSLPASAATRASLLGRPGVGPEVEARVRECAILAGLLHNPQLAMDFEDRLERTVFLCADLAEIRDALLSVLAESLHHGSSELAEAVARRLGRDPLPTVLAPGQVRANPYLGPDAPADRVARALGEALQRHATCVGHATELREAEAGHGGLADEGVVWRLREAAEASQRAALEPLMDGDTESALEADAAARLRVLTDPDTWRKPSKR